MLKIPRPDRRFQFTRLALLTAFFGAPLAAQELVGTVRFPDGVTPAPGVLLVGLRPNDPTVVAQAITGENGAYLLRLPTGTHRLRALRVGYRPTELGQVSLAAGERRRVDYTLAEVPVVLAAITSRATARCEVADRAGGRVATLFDEARKALLSSQLTPPEGRPSARILLEQSVEELDGKPRVTPVHVVGAGFAARPFRSAPPAQLAALGYALEESDGTTFFAPDANVLLSEQFAAMHCLRLASTDSARPDRVGIAFEPVGRAHGLVRIRGTIWLGAATLGLERLEFSYVGLPAGLDDAGLGGSIDFAQLPGGLWFEDRWQIRMPRMRIERQARVTGIAGTGSTDLVRLDAVQKAGGRVISIERPDRVLYASAGNEPELRLVSDPEPIRTAAMLVRAGCSTDLIGDAEPRSTVVGEVLERSARPTPGARVEAKWQEGHRIDTRGPIIRWIDRNVTTVSEFDGFYALCGLPRERRFVVQATQGERLTPRAVLRFEAEVDHMRADLRFLSPP